MLAVNALIFTLLIGLLIGGTIMWLFFRPVAKVVNDACERIDESQHAKSERERLEREEEIRLRAEAERELREEFPNLKEGQG